MSEQTHFKISEVANLTGISRQTLIYYDKKNILKPAFVDDNDYRYYAIPQIHQVQVITLLKEFGIPLKEIRFYLDNKDQEELLDLFDALETKLTAQIKTAENFLKIIHMKKTSIQKSIDAANYQAIHLEMRKAFPVFRGEHLKKEDQNGAGHFNNAYAMEATIKKHGLLGFGLNVIVEGEQLNSNYNNYISYFYIPLNNKQKKISNYTVPGGLYVTTYHKGSHQSSYRSYHRLIQYIHDNNLIIDGDAYESVILDFLTEDHADEYLSEISIKVRT